MKLMWFENFWMLSVEFLFLPLRLPFCLDLVSAFSFTVPVLSISVSTSPFSGSIALVLSKGSNSGALAPFRDACENLYGPECLAIGSDWEFRHPSLVWYFEPYGWTFWRNKPSWVRMFSHRFGLKIRTSKFNLTFKAGLLRSLKKPTEGRILKKGSNWHFEFLPCW